MAVQTSGDHQVIVPMGASKTPRYRYQARAAQTLKEICDASELSTVEFAALLQTRTGKSILAPELEEWKSGEKEFPAWIIPALIDIGGSRLEHGPWAERSPRLRSRLAKIGVAVVAGGLLGVAAFPLISRVVPTAAQHQGPVASAAPAASPTPLPASAPSAAPTPAPVGQASTVPTPAPSSLSGAPVTFTPPPTNRPQGPTPAPGAHQPAPPAAPTPAPTATATPTPAPTPTASPTPAPRTGLLGGVLGLLGGVLGILGL